VGLVSFLSEKLTRARSFKQLPVGNFYDLSFKSLNGQEVQLEAFKSKSLLIVNTASKCGFTYQYEELQKLYEQYGDKVTVVGFPANNFLWQEPAGNDSIAEFCQVNFGVTFPMAEKTSVKGSTKHPIFKWLEAKTGKTPSWNFCKYLVSKNAENVKFFTSKVSPLDPSITNLL
jgi:glutathione peroxidase